MKVVLILIAMLLTGCVSTNPSINPQTQQPKSYTAQQLNRAVEITVRGGKVDIWGIPRQFTPVRIVMHDGESKVVRLFEQGRRAKPDVYEDVIIALDNDVMIFDANPYNIHTTNHGHAFNIDYYRKAKYRIHGAGGLSDLNPQNVSVTIRPVRLNNYAR